MYNHQILSQLPLKMEVLNVSNNNLLHIPLPYKKESQNLLVINTWSKKSPPQLQMKFKSKE